ncbi:hypothetical protein BS50DRAFT_620211 [Corynespora cassiicola Philippines]|uniref:Zn(2)-C6 fungal-type domain-containing protein n=1 Tax=Corynespora cassiicola Philippines TaxID=1448308 RepID=A0A2T2NQM6_CORCC|nr:hypothetical protein BS50DRAFT_620211 [Corynespora cassiicola Philippines]
MAKALGDGAVRKRRPHTKSRRGCGNCKTRHEKVSTRWREDLPIYGCIWHARLTVTIKCDERKPQCRKCHEHGLVCSYNTKDKMATFSESSSWIIELPKPPRPRPLRAPLISSNASWHIELDASSLAALDMFENYTLYTLGDMWLPSVYKSTILKMAFAYPPLLHGILTIAATHSRYLRSASDPAPLHRTPDELYHWSQAASLFAQTLSHPIDPQSRDAVYATSVNLSGIAFCCIETSDPRRSWPMQPSPPSPPDPGTDLDLVWLRMNEGKAQVWALTDPTRPDSIFSSVSQATASKMPKLPTGGVGDGVPPALARLCGLREGSSSPDNNAYFRAAHALGYILAFDPSRESSCRYFSFLGFMDEGFRELLRGRDPTALVLLALWYSMAKKTVWWLSFRAEVELKAIRMYLARSHEYHGDRLEELLEITK